MNSDKYYDYTNAHPIDLKKDGCELDKWNESYGKATFAKHPKGFLVFLPPSKLNLCDEYKDADPYSVEERIDNAFHKRRIDCTLEMINEAIKSIDGTPRILDIGCGEGHITGIIKQTLPETEVSALDYSISAVEYATEHFPDCDFIVGDAYNAPYTENYFDIVVCNNLWEHVPGTLDLLNSITKVLKPNGFVIISTPSRYRLGNLARVLVGKKAQLISKHHVTEYSVGQVKEQLKFGGYEVTKSYSRPEVKSGLVAKIMNKLFKSIITMTGSHHLLETTIFYLAKNVDNKSE